MNDTPRRRSVRSYVLRRGRMTRAQAKALETLSAKYVLANGERELDLDQIFGRRGEKILDIGSGMGETVLRLAADNPECDFLAVEVHPPGIGGMLRQLEKRGIPNVRLIRQDVIEVLQLQLAADSLAAASVYFPDPWPKKRHHKRRLVNAAFLRLLTPKLAAHGRLYLATDDAGMAAHLLQVCDAEPGLVNLAGRGRYAPRPRWRPLTKFERRGLRLGNRIWDLIYARA